ncbi:phosphoribosyl 1,2-cyclic phosphodiesterase [Panacagrimonas perspica]|uniref:Phosphoribosyl 1,2-cyclic phosphodiesterase n=2 Tax=Panacagrimonas perspica TaxID=381431 RepID=A0A4S3K203_9GAMM|nr:phosphoribosyl 1,2-cyclic phosphodiesterase [Panacagrimonas perspica]THD01948.1 MBL fold metallo-hydrolase [Panacagrimonas perspica]
MRVRFWGTRGSLPVALTAAELRMRMARALVAARGRKFSGQREAESFLDELPRGWAHTWGGHSSCVQIELDGPRDQAREFVLCDLGSGVRRFGQELLATLGRDMRCTFHVFMSHLHWDHIMGFPFFTPAYLPGNTVRIYGGHANLRAAFERQQDAPSFPVPLSALGARLEFVQLEPDRRYDIAGLNVKAKLQRHSGGSYGFRFERNGRAVVYSTDSEHTLEAREEIDGFVDFFRDADLVIFDAMYSLADVMTVKADWGHSSNVVGVELCQLAGARHLALYHHEPIFGDERIAEIEAETRRLEEITRAGRSPLQVTAAWDGLEIEL